MQKISVIAFEAVLAGLKIFQYLYYIFKFIFSSGIRHWQIHISLQFISKFLS